MASGWLTFILSEANHRLSHVEPWVAERLTTLEASVGRAVRALDFSDDRLAAVLDYLSADEPWQAFEQALAPQLLRVYDLHPQRVRIDSTTTKGYRGMTSEGLFQLGHSKDHRPDLPQVKINLSVLDPLGLPLSTTVVSGERADDPLYVPEIQRVQASVGRRGLTYVGDCKMAALQTRATVAASGDYYLCPLASPQIPAAELAAVLAPVWQGEQPLKRIYRPGDATRQIFPDCGRLRIPGGTASPGGRRGRHVDRTAFGGPLAEAGRQSGAGGAPTAEPGAERARRAQ